MQLEYPSNLIYEYLGKPNIHAIKTIKITDIKYRVNIWEKQIVEGCVVPKILLTQSYFFEVINNTVKDITIRK